MADILEGAGEDIWHWSEEKWRNGRLQELHYSQNIIKVVNRGR
jgi:hypothetical protein